MNIIVLSYLFQYLNRQFSNFYLKYKILFLNWSLNEYDVKIFAIMFYSLKTTILYLNNIKSCKIRCRNRCVMLSQC